MHKTLYQFVNGLFNNYLRAELPIRVFLPHNSAQAKVLVMSLNDLICYIRQQLLQAKESKDDKTVEYLGKALDVLYEAALDAKDKPLSILLEDFVEAVRDYFMKVEWKSHIPTIEEIRAIFDEEKKG